MSAALQSSRVVILVKAVPNPSQKYGETVCCAGVTADGHWRRLFPIRFRHLKENRFKRWDWVTFGYRRPTSDARTESCHVFEDKIQVTGELAARERARFLNPIVMPSATEAAARGMSLALVRPLKSVFRYRPKSNEAMESEREGYRRAARQTSMLDAELEALAPTPYEFEFLFEDAAGKHKMECGDWETSAAFWNIGRTHGQEAALAHLTKMYNEDYPQKGMVFALGTMRKRPKQWLLLGVIRLDEDAQGVLPF